MKAGSECTTSVSPPVVAGEFVKRTGSSSPVRAGVRGKQLYSDSGLSRSVTDVDPLLHVLRIQIISQHSLQRLCSSCSTLPKHVLQLGVTLLQLLLVSPRDGMWARALLAQLNAEKDLAPSRRDLLPIEQLPPVGAVIQGCKRFSANSVGMLVANSGPIHGNHCQQRAKLMKACAVQTWRLLIVILLNGESVNWCAEKPFVRCKLNASQQEALRNLTLRCEAFCSSPMAEFKVGDFSEIVRTKTIDYSGEEVTYALPLKLGELLPGLPDAGIAGTLESSEVADEEVRSWLLHPEVALKPLADWPVRVPQAKINTSKSEWYRICAVLFERGILAPIGKEDIFSVEGVPVLNGAFAVAKKGEPLPGESRITRLIMNMVPSNSYQILQKGDLPTLASSTGWAGVVLESHQALLWSGDDQKGAFYAWRLPVAWRPFMAFRWPVPGSCVGRPREDWVFMCSAVIPMGWLQAVSLFQHLHRQLGIEADHAEEEEWRRDRPIPVRAGGVSKQWYQFYLDDFDCPEFVPIECWRQMMGKMSPTHQAQRQAYKQIGVAISEQKAHVRVPVVVRMGAEVDGIRGTIGAPMDKLMEVCWFSVWLLGHKIPMCKALLMVLGRFVRCFEFRRPLMSLLDDCWPTVSSNVRVPISASFARCILRCCGIIPLAFSDLRASVSGTVSCSDASEHGGGMCVSVGLTDAGVNLWTSLQSSEYVRSRIAPFAPLGAMRMTNKVGPRIFVLSLFDGISAIMCALCRLNCQVVGFASSEIDRECKRLVRKRWPGVIELGSVVNIDAKTIEALHVGLGVKVDVVLITAGSPCQDLSSLLADGKGLDGSRSRLFFEIPRIYGLCKKRFSCRVELLVENVFSMTLENRKRFNEVLQIKPYLIDSCNLSWCRRPRLYWLSWQVIACPGETIIDKDDYFEWTMPIVRGDAGSWLDAGSHRAEASLMPTLTRSLPRPYPPRQPAGLEHASEQAQGRWKADMYRFQVYQYESKNMVKGSDGQLRTPSLNERERLMGFDLNYVSGALPPKLSPSQSFDLGASMIGNSFHVGVVTMACHALLQTFDSKPAPRAHAALMLPDSAPLGWTSYPLFNQVKAPVDPRCALMVQEMMRMGDRAGTDIRVDLGVPFRFKAFPRAGVNASVFQWKIIHGYKWKHHAHINFLELQAVINSLQWRLRKISAHRTRVLHLVDSQVVASIIAKGRTSSFRLRKALKRLNALLLCSGVTLSVAYVHTTDNPADIPSRWSSPKIVKNEKQNARALASNSQ